MYAAVDIGGTKTLIAVFDESGTVLEEVKFPTPKDYNEFKVELAKTAATLKHHTFAHGAIGIRGNIDRERGLSLYDDVLPWGEVAVRDDCEAIFKCKFVMENDSKAAGFGEAKQAGSHFHKVLYVTISTGIGSAFVVDGEIDPDTENSEIGKTLYEHDGKVQQWEDFASGKAIVAKYGQRASEIEDYETWKEISHDLAIGFINACAVYTPDLIVLGGGVGTYFDKYKQTLNEAIHKMKPEELTVPEIRRAIHPEEAVIYGCYHLAKNAHGKAA
jgi:predicted NBD/HSP70 family sugar kinase